MYLTNPKLQKLGSNFKIYQSIVRVRFVHKTLNNPYSETLDNSGSILKKSLFIKEMICGHALAILNLKEIDR